MLATKDILLKNSKETHERILNNLQNDFKWEKLEEDLIQRSLTSPNREIFLSLQDYFNVALYRPDVKDIAKIVVYDFCSKRNLNFNSDNFSIWW
jgi:hypothetical protein